MSSISPKFNPMFMKEPNFIPGYTGHCPRFTSESVGRTFGVTTQHVMQELPFLRKRLMPVTYEAAATKEWSLKNYDMVSRDVSKQQEQKPITDCLALTKKWYPAAYVNHMRREKFWHRSIQDSFQFSPKAIKQSAACNLTTDGGGGERPHSAEVYATRFHQRYSELYTEEKWFEPVLPSPTKEISKERILGFPPRGVDAVARFRRHAGFKSSLEEIWRTRCPRHGWMPLRDTNES